MIAVEIAGEQLVYWHQVGLTNREILAAINKPWSYRAGINGDAVFEALVEAWNSLDLSVLRTAELDAAERLRHA